jgi:hypothetical protein
MRPYRHLLAAASFLALASSSFAASQDEANQIKAAFEKYLTAEPGVVTVSVVGDAYDVTLDFNPFAAKIKQPDFSGSMAKLTYRISPQGGGKWQVDQNQPFDLSLKAGPAFDISYKVGTAKLSGIWDEALSGFATSTMDFSNFDSVQTIDDSANKTRQVTKTKAAGFKGDQTSTLNAKGGVDFKGTYTSGAANSDSTFDTVTGPFKLAYTTDSSTSEYSGTNFRQREILSLIAWFVARPSPEAIKKDQTELRELVRLALPMFDNINAIVKAGKVDVTTNYGSGSLSGVDIAVDMNGLTSDGKIREAFKLSGITLPDGILPPWSKPVLPTDISLDFAVTGFNAADPIGLIIDNMDLNAKPPLKSGIEMQLLGMALPKSTFQVALNPGSIKSTTYEISYDGTLDVSLGGPPSGKGTLKMKGFDQTLQSLQQAAATDPSINQVIGPMMAAKGFSKQEGDVLVWNLESTPQGGVLVNGIDVTKMGAP